MIVIKPAGIEQAETVFALVEKLLFELRENAEDSAMFDRDKVINNWNSVSDRFVAFIAYDGDQAAGVITLVECFAIYAGGSFGIINELYVAPEYRSRKIGRQLLETVKDFGRSRGWKRIDVTAPPGPRWERTVRFYEREGFLFTGPKLKFHII